MTTVGIETGTHWTQVNKEDTGTVPDICYKIKQFLPLKTLRHEEVWESGGVAPSMLNLGII
jgi:hypothetical protein